MDEIIARDLGMARDPARRWLRHSYQEGPGFRLLATRGKSEVLDREVFRSLADADAALDRFARYYNYHRLHGEIGWLTPGERYDGTPFTDRGFDFIPALQHLVSWLDELRKAA